jgi:alcohol dehydrogenase class IV
MQVGAFFAGAALMNSGAGPAGACSYPLGTLYGVPHGLAGAVFLAPVAEWNLDHGSDAYAGLADALPAPPANGSPGDRSAAVVGAIRDLSGRLGVPGTLRDFGLDEGGLEEFVENAMLLEPALRQNPVPFDREGLVEVVRRLGV